MTVLPRNLPRKRLKDRDTIIEAAAHRTRDAGFNGANMASIAQTANLSVGQIYRHFENKEAIIEAIVERNAVEFARHIDSLRNQDGKLSSDLAAIFSTALHHKQREDWPSLRLEITAEASRNPRVAQIVRKAVDQERDHFLSLLSARCASVSDEATLLARYEILCMLFDGMSMRTVTSSRASAPKVVELLEHLVTEIVDRTP